MLFVFSCAEESTSLTQEEEAGQLEQMLTEIRQMAAGVSCQDAADWKFTPYGSKACGGPVGFLAYPTTIDTAAFLRKVEEHRQAQEEFNKKWEIFSDCSIPPTPTGVSCKNGEAVLVY